MSNFMNKSVFHDTIRLWLYLKKDFKLFSLLLSEYPHGVFSIFFPNGSPDKEIETDWYFSPMSVLLVTHSSFVFPFLLSYAINNWPICDLLFSDSCRWASSWRRPVWNDISRQGRQPNLERYGLLPWSQLPLRHVWETGTCLKDVCVFWSCA